MARTYTYNVGASAGAAPEVAVPAGWRVTFADYFDGSSVDTSKWNVRNGDKLSYDLATVQSANARVTGGKLYLDTKAEVVSGRNYTTAYIDTIGKFSQRGGRFQVYAKINTVPTVSKGVWPAPLWLRGDSSGMEIDICESWGTGAAGPILGWREGSSQGSIHQSTYGGAGKVSGFMSSPGTILSDSYHLYECIWEADGANPYVSLLLDGVEKVRATTTNAPWITGSDFAGAVNLRVNCQVGGYYGNPEAGTEFPTSCLVDYIRVLERV
jgi:beta-glucanase (GH16 family)